MTRKKISLLILATLLTCIMEVIPTSANSSDYDTSLSTIEQLGNGYYFETIIENSFGPSVAVPNGTTKYITKTKTTQMKNSAGTVLWSISIKATFSYDGTTSKCTSCSHSCEVYASAWSIDSISSSRSGNSATTKAIATYTAPSGASQSYSKSVTIKCSATGVVS